jgi:hypothetical protein
MSRQQFAHTRPEVEKAINEWMAPIKVVVAPKPVKANPITSAPAKTQAPLPPRQQPSAKSQPVPAKPFAAAFKTMEKDSIPARAKQIEGVDEDLPSITLVKDPNAQKSVPLASLSSSASKVPTPERVSALKAALAKAMETKKEPVQISQPPQPPEVPEVPEDVLKKALKVE